jgi:hypothetical protein
MTAAPTSSRAIEWRWSRASFAATAAVPALVVTPFDVPLGLALAFGVLPAILVGVVPARRQRARVLPVGALTAVSITLGSLVAEQEVVAVVTVFVVALGSALLATRTPLGRLMLAMAVPMVGIGFSFQDDPAKGAAVGLLILAGTAYAFLLSLLWPDRPVVADAPPPRPALPAMVDYGIRLGLAGATAAAIGFALDLDHVGWQVAAALLVMRPVAEMQRLRSVGRVVSVAVGAFTAAGVAATSPPDGVYAVAAASVLVAAGATQPSRWYVTPAFTTFIVISLLLYARPEDTAYRVGQRIIETIVGVAIAYLFGLFVPELRRRRERPTSSTT